MSLVSVYAEYSLRCDICGQGRRVVKSRCPGALFEQDGWDAVEPLLDAADEKALARYKEENMTRSGWVRFADGRDVCSGCVRHSKERVARQRCVVAELEAVQ